MPEYYKGFTQHLNSTGRDDVDPAAMLSMDMIPGLFLMKHVGQEGYVLPVCKFINDFRSDIIGQVKISTDGPSQHPRYIYATLNNKDITLHTHEVIPHTIKGGIVSITNIMRTKYLRRYYSLECGNLADLISSEDIEVLFSVKQGEGEGLILKINKPCRLTVEHGYYDFSFTEENGEYTDFNCEIHY